MFCTFLSSSFSQIIASQGLLDRRSATVSPARSYIFGANIDIFLKSRKKF